MTLLTNTAILAAAVAAISLPLGTALAVLLVRTDVPGRRIGLFALACLLFVPLYLQVGAWQAGFGLQGWCAPGAQNAVWLDGWSGAIVLHSLAALPWVVLLVGLGLAGIEPELEESALLDAPAWKVLLCVTLPRTLPAVAVAGMWVLLITAGEITITDLCRVRTYAEELYTQLALGVGPGEATLAVLPGALLAGGLVLLGVVFCLLAVPRDDLLTYRRAYTYRLGALRWPNALLLGAILLVLAGLPLGSLVYQSGVTVTPVDGAWVRGWSMSKAISLVAAAPSAHASEWRWSFLLAGMAAAAALTIGTLLAWSARRGGWKSVPAVAVSVLGLAVPSPAIGLGLIELFNRPEIPGLVYLYDQTIVVAWLGQTLRALPLATLVMWHFVRRVPQELLDAAAVDGAGPWRRWTRVAWPLLRRRMFGLGLVLLAVALGDLTVTLLVAPPGVMTVSMRVFQFLHAGVDDRLAAVCLAQGMAIFGLTALAIPLLGGRR